MARFCAADWRSDYRKLLPTAADWTCRSAPPRLPAENISAPTLLIRGDADPISPVAVGRELERRIQTRSSALCQAAIMTSMTRSDAVANHYCGAPLRLKPIDQRRTMVPENNIIAIAGGINAPIECVIPSHETPSHVVRSRRPYPGGGDFEQSQAQTITAYEGARLSPATAAPIEDPSRRRGTRIAQWAGAAR
jgi:hypothetical protein